MYDGVCLRVGRTIIVAVPQVVSRPVVWKGYRFLSKQLTGSPQHGIQETAHGQVAEVERAILDLLYFGYEPDNIEFEMIDSHKLHTYAQTFPPRVRNTICL